jgi:membrane protein
MIRRLKAAGRGWVEDEVSHMGAGLAYYTLFSLMPLLLLAIAVIGALFGEDQTKEHVVAQVNNFIDNDSALAVEAMLDSFRTSKAFSQASIIGIVSLVFGATGMFTSLRSSLSRIWRLPPVNEDIVTGLVKTYLLAFLMIFVTCVFLILLLLVSTVMPLLAQRWVEQIPSIPWSGSAANLVASTFLLTLLFVFTFRFLSDGQIRYSQVWGGALVSALLFTVGKMAIGYYLAYANLSSAYGAAGSVVVFLAWIYYSSQIVFFGAEVIRFGLPGAASRAA